MEKIRKTIEMLASSTKTWDVAGVDPALGLLAARPWKLRSTDTACRFASRVFVASELRWLASQKKKDERSTTKNIDVKGLP